MVKEEIIREIKKYLEINENENKTCQNLWNEVKAEFRRKSVSARGKLIAVNIYIKKIILSNQ